MLWPTFPSDIIYALLRRTVLKGPKDAARLLPASIAYNEDRIEKRRADIVKELAEPGKVAWDFRNFQGADRRDFSHCNPFVICGHSVM